MPSAARWVRIPLPALPSAALGRGLSGSRERGFCCGARAGNSRRRRRSNPQSPARGRGRPREGRSQIVSGMLPVVQTAMATPRLAARRAASEAAGGEVLPSTPRALTRPGVGKRKHAPSCVPTRRPSRTFRYCGQATTVCCWRPRPWISSAIVSPTLRNTGGFMPRPTPGGVPVVTTSPASSTMNCEM